MNQSIKVTDDTAKVVVATAALTGWALCFAVAVAEGLAEEITWCQMEGHDTGLNMWTDNHGSYDPARYWDIGGPLIAEHAIGFVGHDADNWLAFSSPADETHQGIGPTHLIAACRLIVRAKLGTTVQVPAELLP